MRILVAILLCAAALPAQNLLSEQEVRASMEAKERARKSLWEAKDYRAAVRLLEEVVADPALRRYPDLHLNNLYNLACAYALAGDAAKAVARLRELLDLGYRNVPNIQRDTDFDSIRTDPSYLAANRRDESHSRFLGRPRVEDSLPGRSPGKRQDRRPLPLLVGSQI